MLPNAQQIPWSAAILLIIILGLSLAPLACQRDQSSEAPDHTRRIEEGLGGHYKQGGVFDWNPDFSPDSQRIVLVSLRQEPSELYLVDVDGSSRRRITNMPGWKMDPIFCPDGQHLLFASDADDLSGGLYIMSIAGSSPKRIAPTLSAIFDPSFDATGKRIAFSAGRNGNEGIYVCNLDGSALISVTRDEFKANSPLFLQEEQSLVFSRLTTPGKSLLTQGELCIANIQKKTVNPIVQEEAVRYLPFAVRGQRIYFLRTNLQTSQDEIWSCLEDGNGRKRIANATLKVGEPEITPDGKTIAFTSDLKEPFEYEICTIDAEGIGPPKQLTSLHGYLSGLRIAPNGNQILFVFDKKGAPGRGKGELELVPINGGEVRKVCSNF